MANKIVEVENFQSGFCVTVFVDGEFVSNTFGDKVESNVTGSINTVTVSQKGTVVSIIMSNEVFNRCDK